MQTYGIDWTGVPTAELEAQYALAKQMVGSLQAAGPRRQADLRFWSAVQRSASAEVVRRREHGTGRWGRGAQQDDADALLTSLVLDYRRGEDIYVRHPPIQACPDIYEPITMGTVEATRRDGGVYQILVRFAADAVFWIDASQISRESLHFHYDQMVDG